MAGISVGFVVVFVLLTLIVIVVPGVLLYDHNNPNSSGTEVRTYSTVYCSMLTSVHSKCTSLLEQLKGQVANGGVFFGHKLQGCRKWCGR